MGLRGQKTLRSAVFSSRVFFECFPLDFALVVTSFHCQKDVRARKTPVCHRFVPVASGISSLEVALQPMLHYVRAAGS